MPAKKMKKVSGFSELKENRFPYPQGNTDEILLYLDNTKVTYEMCIEIASQTVNRSENEKIKAIRRYVTGQAAGDMRKNGDWVQAELLGKAIREMKKACTEDQQIQYWKSVWSNYFQIAVEHQVS